MMRRMGPKNAVMEKRDSQRMVWTSPPTSSIRPGRRSLLHRICQWRTTSSSTRRGRTNFRSYCRRNRKSTISPRKRVPKGSEWSKRRNVGFIPKITRILSVVLTRSLTSPRVTSILLSRSRAHHRCSWAKPARKSKNWLPRMWNGKKTIWSWCLPRCNNVGSQTSSTWPRSTASRKWMSTRIWRGSNVNSKWTPIIKSRKMRDSLRSKMSQVILS